MLRQFFGPSTLVTAAFIGPGTVTVCTLAGVQSGYTLLWALLFSVLATIVLQEMTARLGLITQRGFGEAMRAQLNHPVGQWLGIALVLSAIVIGNAAYEGGNLAGAALGVQELLGSVSLNLGFTRLALTPLLIGAIAWIILASGSFRLIERALLSLVAIMSLVFLSTAVISRPDWGAVSAGLLLPRASTDDWLLVVALLGTTVVPYNLFLHAAIVGERYHGAEDLPAMRLEIAVAMLIGGLISMSIVITSAANLQGLDAVRSAADMATQLEPLLGAWAPPFLALGLFAAGISSAITAPLAAAYAARGILGWDPVAQSSRFKRVWQVILIAGLLVASTDWNPVLIIQFAQVANGILLPVVVGFLLYLMNRQALLGSYTNTRLHNVFGAGVFLVTILLGSRSLNSVFQFFG